MILYLDVVIFENIFVNMFLIYITSQTVRVRAKIKNILESSVLGSTYVLTIIYPSLHFFSCLPFKLIIALFMIAIAFRRWELLFDFKASAIFILYSMLLAGLCMFVSVNYSNNFTFRKLLLAIMIIYLVINRLVIYVKDRKSMISLIFPVDIVLKNTHKVVKAFLDTGNELREPATNLPVIIVEKGVLSDTDGCDKFLVPYKTVNGTIGNLEGFKPDFVTVYINGKPETRDVIVALCENKLDKFNDYEALLSRGII